MEPLSYFQAIILGLLQGVTELFPISSLGHTVLFPTLFGWDSLVKAQSQSESFWLAFVVLLHVGSALGLLAYYWRDWLAIIKAFFATLGKRRAETPTERLAWLIICASIPTGLIGLAFEHQFRTFTAKPLLASIFLVVNGFILLGAEVARRRRWSGTTPRSSLDTLEYREAGLVGVAQSTALFAGISRDGVCMGTGPCARPRPLRLGALRVSARDPDHPRGRACSSSPTSSGRSATGVRGQSVVPCISAAIAAYFTVKFLVRYFKTRTLTPFAVYCLVFGLAMVIYNG